MNDVTPDPINSVPASSDKKVIEITIAEPAPGIMEFTDGQAWAYVRQPTEQEPNRTMRIKLLQELNKAVNILDGEEVVTEYGVLYGEQFTLNRYDVPGLHRIYGNYNGAGSKLQLH